MNKKRIFIIATVAVLFALFAFSPEQVRMGLFWLDEDLVTRERVHEKVSYNNFGHRFIDFKYVAADYIYNHSEIIERYGEGFAVEAVRPGAFHWYTFFFRRVDAGSATARVAVQGDYWIVDMSKRPFGRWTVQEMRLYQ